MIAAVQIGETARDGADFCRRFKTGTAVFLHDDGIDAHSTYGSTLRAAYTRTNCDTRGCKPFRRAPNASGLTRSTDLPRVRWHVPKGARTLLAVCWNAC